MYDDGHVYTDKAGSLKNAAPVEAKKEEKVPESKTLVHKKHHHHKHGNGEGRDTFDFDPDTTSMYDDQHAYTKPGTFTPDGAPKTHGDKPEKNTSPIPVPIDGLVQKTLKARDTFDKDPTTASMYDDGHVYTDHAGSLGWKFAGGPAAEYAAATGFNPHNLVQTGTSVQKKSSDTFDKDDKNQAEPADACVYDDQHAYAAKPGSLKNIQIVADESSNQESSSEA